MAAEDDKEPIRHIAENELAASIRPGREPTKIFERFAADTLALAPAKNKLENWLFQKAWLVLAVILLFDTILTFIIPKIVQPEHNKALLDEMVQFSSKVMYPFLIILILEKNLLVHLIKKTSQVFVDLEFAGRLKKPSSLNKNVPANSDQPSTTRKIMFYRLLPTSADNFEEEMIAAVKSNWRYLFVVMFLGLSAYFVLEYKNFQLVFQSGYWPNIAHTVLVMIIMPLFVSYITGLAIWLMIVISVYISKLNSVFEIKVNPTHPDKAGGLRRLGGLTLHMAIIALLPILFLSAWSLGGYWGEQAEALLELRVVGILVVLVLNIFVFLWPIWNIHEEMVRVGILFQDEVMKEIDGIQTRMKNLLRTSSIESVDLALNQVEILKRQIEMIREVKQIDNKFPSWPFDSDIVLKFTIPQILPVLSLLAGLGEAENNIVKLFIDMIMGWFGGGGPA